MTHGCLQSKPATASDNHEPELLRPSGKKDGILDGMKSVKIDQADVPEWMKPNEDLLSKVQADKELASAVDNAKITKVCLKMLCVWCALIVP